MKGLLTIILTAAALTACSKKPVGTEASLSVTPVTVKTDTPQTPPADTTKATSPAPAVFASVTTTSNYPGSPTTGAYNYLALGDSYTIGQSVPLEQSFPYQLVAELNKQIKVNTPVIVARTGWTTNDLLTAIAGKTGKTNYDLVTLLIGVNDQFQNVGQTSYRVAFIEALQKAIALANKNNSRVFVLSIPDYSVTPFAADYNRAKIADDIDAYNNINKFETKKAGVAYLDITDISRQAATDATLLADDGLHPSGKMYGLWAKRLAPLVLAELNR